MIRSATPEDVPRMLAIYAPYVQNTTYSFEYSVPTEAEFLRRFQTYTLQFPWLVWEEDGALLGYAYASAPFERAAYAWCSESSVYLAPHARGRGIGAALYTALESFLRRQGYQLNYALVTSENQISVAFHEKMGYKIAADFPDCGYKFGRWVGVIWMEKRLNPVENVRNIPCSWLSIRQN